MRSAVVNSRAVSTTCWTSGLPPARCKTLAFRDFIRVPRPAARITTVTGSCIFLLWLCGPAPHRFGWMVIGVTAEKITVTLDGDQLGAIRAGDSKPCPPGATFAAHSTTRYGPHCAERTGCPGGRPATGANRDVLICSGPQRLGPFR